MLISGGNLPSMDGSSPCDHLVLVVDDDADIRESLSDVLTDEGYQVVTAVDGRDALVKLRGPGVAPCVILLDLMMPVMSGVEFYAEKQSDPKLSSIPVVIVSADGNVRLKASSLGGEYIAKPVRIEQVLDAVQRHCA